MKLKIITLQTLMRFVKFCVAPMGVWPLSVDCSRYKVFGRNIVRFSALFISSTTISVMIYALCKKPNFHTVVELSSEIAVVSGVVFKLIVFKAHDDSLQMLIVELEEFLEQMSPEEDEFFQNYLQKSIYVHLGFMTGCIVGPLTFIGVSILYWGQWLPGTTDYPILPDFTWGWWIMFTHQAWVSWLVGCMANMDVFFVSLLWSVTVRFELLAREYSQAASVPDFERCIARHQIIMNYSQRLTNIVRWVVVIVNSMTVTTVSFGGFYMVLQPEAKDVVSFLTMLVDATFELFLYTWAAENLLASSANIGYAVYSSDWFGAPPDLLLDMRIVMRRTTNPEVITISGLFPVLGLEYFGSALSMIFSYIATLRAITME